MVIARTAVTCLVLTAISRPVPAMDLVQQWDFLLGAHVEQALPFKLVRSTLLAPDGMGVQMSTAKAEQALRAWWKTASQDRAFAHPEGSQELAAWQMERMSASLGTNGGQQPMALFLGRGAVAIAAFKPNLTAVNVTLRSLWLATSGKAKTRYTTAATTERHTYHPEALDFQFNEQIERTPANHEFVETVVQRIGYANMHETHIQVANELRKNLDSLALSHNDVVEARFSRPSLQDPKSKTLRHIIVRPARGPRTTAHQAGGTKLKTLIKKVHGPVPMIL